MTLLPAGIHTGRQSESLAHSHGPGCLGMGIRYVLQPQPQIPRLSQCVSRALRAVHRAVRNHNKKIGSVPVRLAPSCCPTAPNWHWRSRASRNERMSTDPSLPQAPKCGRMPRLTLSNQLGATPTWRSSKLRMHRCRVNIKVMTPSIIWPILANADVPAAAVAVLGGLRGSVGHDRLNLHCRPYTLGQRSPLAPETTTAEQRGMLAHQA